MLPSEPPASIAGLFEGVEVEPAEMHWSDAWVGRAGGLFVKASPPGALSPARPEWERLQWLTTIDIAAPEVVAYEEAEDGWQWLVTEAVPGRPLRPHREAMLDPRQAAELLADALRSVHAIPVERCPFRTQERAALERAHAEHARGDWSDEDGYLQEVAGEGLTVELAFAEAEESVPSVDEDPVVCHGDASGFNLIVACDDDGRDTWTWIDWGRAGVAHRASDLATAIIAVRLDIGDDWVEPFLDRYGTRPDPTALRHFTVVDGLS